MRTLVVRAAFLAAVLPAGAAAQTLSLTEPQALARLSAGSPRVGASRAGVDVARADIQFARRWPNPRLTVDRESVAGTTEYIAMISQPVPITGRRGFDTQAASALAAASSSRSDDEVRRLRADLRLVFAGLLAAQTRERELMAARDRLRELTGILAARERAGDAAGFDRLRAERETLDMETDLAVAVTERSRAQADLAGFFADRPDASHIVAVGSPGSPVPIPALDVLLTQAETTRGDLIAFTQEIAAAGFAARSADRRRLPEPEIAAGTKSSTFGTGDVGGVLMLHATIPVFDRGRPERALAAAQRAHAETRAAAFRAVLHSQAAALRAAVIERRAAAERYRSEAVGMASQIERIAQVSYDAGERGILELLDAFRIGASARVRQAMLDLAVRQAEIELEFATGWEIPS